MTITLKDAVLATQTGLRNLAKKDVTLVHVLGRVSGIVASLSEGGEESILRAMDACRAITDNAHTADDAGCTEVAERLRCISRMLSSVAVRARDTWLGYDR